MGVRGSVLIHPASPVAGAAQAWAVRADGHSRAVGEDGGGALSFGDWLISLPAPAVYAVVGGTVGIESVGVPVPGETALIASALLGTHADSPVRLGGVFLAAWVGAVVGDNIGYLIGRRYGERLFVFLGRRFPRHFAPAYIAYATHLFQRRGASAVFFGRFVALLRILAGPLAGSMGLGYPRFMLANAAGGAAWAGGITLLVGAMGAAAHTWVSGTAWGVLAVMALGAVLVGRRIHRAFEERALAFATRAEHAADRTRGATAGHGPA